jgi:ribosomal protein S6
MEEKENKAENMEADARVYEVGYLLLPTIPGEEVPAVYGNLKELVSSLGGQAISDEMPRQIDLAYQMVKVIQNIRHRFDTAYFGWIKFSMDPEKVLELKKKLTLDPNIIRFLTLKTVKENTIATKKFVRSDLVKRRTPTAKKEGEEAPEQPINKEEIDKEIDALVETQ